ncbi:MAG: hypothetical protein ACLPHP_20540 [Candidatus Sulfotelmatobacter sp.]
MRSLNSRYFCRFLAFLAAMLATLPAAHAAPQENPSDAPGTVCSNLGHYIFVGGTAGFDALRDGDQVAELLKTGYVGLYEHGNAIAAAESPPSILKSIELVFRGTGRGQAELGQVGANYFTLPPSYGFYQAQYIQHGLHPSEANVNTPSDSAAPGQLAKDLKLWREYVDAAKTAGLESVAPIVGPNDPSEPKLGEDVFATNPFYALERGEALYGKAIAFDVPPNFFLNGGSGPGYEKFIVQAIQWGNAHGLRTTVLLSPYPWPANPDGQPETFDEFTGNSFSHDTQVFVNRLLEEHAVPSQWAVDNYEDTYPHDAGAMVPETARNTTTEVGLWLAGNAPVFVNENVNKYVNKHVNQKDDKENSDGVICFPPSLTGQNFDR